MTRQKAIDAKCKECLYDELVDGTHQRGGKAGVGTKNAVTGSNLSQQPVGVLSHGASFEQ